MDVSSLHMSKMDVSSRAADGDVSLNYPALLAASSVHKPYRYQMRRAKRLTTKGSGW